MVAQVDRQGPVERIFEQRLELDRTQGVEPVQRQRFARVHLCLGDAEAVGDDLGHTVPDVLGGRSRGAHGHAASRCPRPTGPTGDAVPRAAPSVARRRLPPDRQRLQCPRQQSLAAREALDFPAGRLLDLARRNQRDSAQLDAVRVGDAAPDGRDCRLRVGGGLELVRIDLRDEGDPVPRGAEVRNEGGDASGPDGAMPALGSPFEVLGMMFRSPDDQHVLQAPGDPHPVVADDAEVSGPEIRTAAGGGSGPERACRLQSPVPVAGGDARPVDPDLSDQAVRTRAMALGVDDDDRGAEAGPATGDAGFAAADRIAGRRSRCLGVEAAARHQQRCLGQPVAWPERGRPEAAVRERGGEPFEGVPPDRFRAVVGVAPAPEIEAGAVRRCDPADAQVVGEVGSAAARRPVPGNRPQPADRSLQERGRRHQIGRGTRCRPAAGHRRSTPCRARPGATRPTPTTGRSPPGGTRRRGCAAGFRG